MKLLLDEMLPYTIAQQLRQRGHDVIAATEAEHEARYAHIPDELVLARAQEDGRTVVTDNIGDYGPLANEYEASGQSYHGVILAPSNQFDRAEPGVVGAFVRSLDAFLRSLPATDEPFNRQHYLKRV